MAAGSTYTPIATYTAPSAQSSVTFSSLGSYTDLILVLQVRETTNQQGYIRFNSDSSSNYSRTGMYGTGSSAASFRQDNQTGVNVGMGDTYSMNLIHIMQYANTSVNKTVICRGDDNNSTNAQVSLWRSSSAITSISIHSLDGSASLATGSTFTLYGIAAA